MGGRPNTANNVDDVCQIISQKVTERGQPAPANLYVIMSFLTYMVNWFIFNDLSANVWYAPTYRTPSSVTSYFEWVSQTSPARRPAETPINVPAITSLTKCQSPAISSIVAMSSSAENGKILVR